MPSLLAILGSCLTAAAVADAADRDAAPSPLNTYSYSGDSVAAGPQAVGYGVAADTLGSKDASSTRRAPTDGVADFAPDPPTATHGRAAPAVLENEANSLATRLAAATESSAEQIKKDLSAGSPPPGTPNVLRPMSSNPPSAAPHTLSATPASYAAPVPRPLLAPTKAATSVAATPVAAAPPLSLGDHGDKGPLGKASPLSAMFTVGGSLSIVLGLFLVIAWAMRKAAPRGAMVLPKEVLEILGRAPLGARQQVQLLRCGSKLLLVSITPHGAETLTEVTDPVEVDRIAGICQQGNPKSSTTSFRQVFQQLAADKPAAADDLQVSGLRRKRYRWEEKHA